MLRKGTVMIMKKVFRLEGLECANCAAKMEKAISKIDGVSDANVNFMTTKLVIEASEDKLSHLEHVVLDHLIRMGQQPLTATWTQV